MKKDVQDGMHEEGLGTKNKYMERNALILC